MISKDIPCGTPAHSHHEIRDAGKRFGSQLLGTNYFRNTVLGAAVLTGILMYSVAANGDERAEKDAKEVPPRARLLTFDGLQERLKEPTLRLLDCRPKSEYDQGHIPGAAWVDAKAVEFQGGKPGGLDDRAYWEAWVKSLGVDEQTEVYVYDAKRQLDAARIWFILRWIGVDNVGLIDGGYPLWVKEGRPVATAAPHIEPRPRAVEFHRNLAANRADILAFIKGRPGQIVDARSDAEYTGTVKRSKRGGHIPNACHLEWTNLVDADGKFLDRSEMLAQIEKLGIEMNDDVITHCQGGGRASVITFALELLGFRARNYYLGWSEWGNLDDASVVEGERRK